MHVPQTNIIRFKALSYSVLMAALVWYVYWVAYDIFLWNKSLIQVNPLNYVGITATVGLIIFGTRIKSYPRVERVPMRTEFAPDVMPLPLRIGDCPYGIDYFDKVERPAEIPRKCLRCSNIIECACKSSLNKQLAKSDSGTD